MKPSCVIVNPASANGKTARQWAQWSKKLRSRIGPFEAVWTKQSGDGETLARQALKQGYKHIHALGGDGTAHEVVNGFFEGEQALAPDATFSLWPAGSACDFWRNFARPGHVTDDAGEFLIDLGRARFISHAGQEHSRYVLNVASCGISGMIDQIVSSRGKALGGRLAFLLATLEALVRYKNLSVSIKSSAGDLGTSPLRCAAVANGQYFGAGMQIAPGARLDDGRLDLIILGDIGRADALFHTPQLYMGRHLHHPKIRHLPVTWVEFESAEPMLIDLDGEALGRLPLRIDVVKSILRVKLWK